MNWQKKSGDAKEIRKTGIALSRAKDRPLMDNRCAVGEYKQNGACLSKWRVVGGLFYQLRCA